MKESFRDSLHLGPENTKKLAIINGIIEEYAAGGYKLTLRQLYYQLVSRDIIPNKVAEYNKLSALLAKGRMAGRVDWEAIEDRIRVPFRPYFAADAAAGLGDLIEQFRLDRIRGQEHYIEVWCEKDALSGVLKPVTSKYHVYLMVNRGYSSVTAMHDAYERILEACDGQDAPHETASILYLGDRDPSGVDMIRDIIDRLEEFGVTPEVSRIALTEEQIDHYHPPPNPAKVSDPRAKDYIEKYGPVSYEVDALRPDVLHDLVTCEIEMRLDMDLFEKNMKEERDEIRKLELAKEKIEEGEIE